MIFESSPYIAAALPATIEWTERSSAKDRGVARHIASTPFPQKTAAPAACTPPRAAAPTRCPVITRNRRVARVLRGRQSRRPAGQPLFGPCILGSGAGPPASYERHGLLAFFRSRQRRFVRRECRSRCEELVCASLESGKTLLGGARSDRPRGRFYFPRAFQPCRDAACLAGCRGAGTVPARR